MPLSALIRSPLSQESLKSFSSSQGCWFCRDVGFRRSIRCMTKGASSNPHADPDLVFDQSLIGSWSAANGKCTTLLTIASKDQVYDLRSTDQGEGCSEERVPLSSPAGETGIPITF